MSDGGFPRLTRVSANRPFIPWIVGNRYDSTAWFGGSYSSSAIVANTMYATPLVPVSDTPGGQIGITALAFRSVADSSGKHGRLALYTMLSTGYPGSLIAQSVEKVEDPGANTTVDDTTFVASLRDLVPIFAVFWGDGTPTLATTSIGSVVGSSGAFGNNTGRAWSVASAYTAGVSSFPSTFPASAAANAIAPTIVLKRGS